VTAKRRGRGKATAGCGGRRWVGERFGEELAVRKAGSAAAASREDEAFVKVVTQA
jgi:hypothetical protein